jgi:hypothetical protein
MNAVVPPASRDMLAVIVAKRTTRDKPISFVFLVCRQSRHHPDAGLAQFAAISFDIPDDFLTICLQQLEWYAVHLDHHA